MTKIEFSIIIPVKELNSYLEESIPKILNIDYDNYEVIILPNQKPIKIPEYIKDKKVKIISTGKVSPAIKRDIGAEKAKGKYLAFLDDDAYPEKNWLKKAEEIFNEKKISAIAGPAITPKDDCLRQKVSGLFFESFFGGGGLDFRYKPAKKSFYVKDFPTVNLIVNKKEFLNVGGFDSEFWPGEDTKFCLDFIKKGNKIWYSNQLIVYHHRRKIFLSHLKQVGNYGKHRGSFARKKQETSLKLNYFIPSVFFLGNLLLFILSFFDMLFLRIWILLLIIYFSLITIDVFTRTLNIWIGFLTIITVFLSHLFYGFKFIQGFLFKNIKSELR